MNNRKKILLRSTSLFGLENLDMHINVDLKSNFKEIRPDSYENNFDLQKQYDKERNSSRNFTIYGGVNSVFTDSSSKILRFFAEILPSSDPVLENNFTIASSTSQQNSGVDTIVLSNGASLSYIGEVTSRPISHNPKNIFGFNEAYYKKDLTDFNYDAIYIVIDQNIVARQQLVFNDADGNFVKYGNDTEEIRENGTTFTVFNDFPFFYNIHWIKLPLEITK